MRGPSAGFAASVESPAKTRSMTMRLRLGSSRPRRQKQSTDHHGKQPHAQSTANQPPWAARIGPFAAHFSGSSLSKVRILFGYRPVFQI
jgi:hypothetical protein